MKEGWEYKKLGEVCNIDFGTRVVRSRDAGSIYPVYGGGGTTFKMDTYNREDCMVISRFGMSEQCTRFVKGRFFLNDSGLTLSMKKHCMIQNYMDWQILYLNNTIYSLGRGAAQKNLDTKALAEIVIAYPNNLSEQQSIVDYLDSAFAKIDAMKANAEKALNEAKALFQASLKVMLEPKEGWEEKKIKDICETVTDFVAAGSFASLRENVVYNSEKDYAQLVRTTDLKSGFSKGGYVYVNEHAFNYLYRVNLNEECVILPNVGVNCGEVYYVTPSILPYNNNVLGPNAVLVRSKNYSNHFLSYLFLGNEFQTKLGDITSHMAQPKFNKTGLKEIEISVPPLSEQQSIVDYLDSLKSKVDRLQENYDKISQECDALKQAMLRQIFE